MPVTRPTKAEVLGWMQATLSGMDSSLVITRDSDAGIKLRMLCEAVYGLHHEAGKIEDDLFVSDRTSTEALDRHADAKLEGGRKGASTGAGTDCLTVTGTLGAVATIGDELTSTDGYRYQLTSGGTIPAGLSISCSVESVDVGEAVNRDSGETLTFSSPAAGIDATATLTDDITGAEDAETDAELIRRLQDAYANPLGSGRLSDFRQWALGVPGIVDAYSYGPTSDAPTGRRGLGYVDVCIVRRGTGASRVPSTTLQGLVEDAIEARRPITTRDYSVILPTEDEIDIEATITPGAGYEFDWDKTQPVAVHSYTAGTRTMVVDDEIADFCVGGTLLAAGHRVLVSGPHWSQMNTVKSVADNTPAGKATIIFDEDFATAPVIGDEFEPGGPLTEPMLEAIEDMFDALGPARGLAFDPNQDWESDVLLAKIDQVLMNIPGVRNVEIDDVGGGGVADYPATDTPPSTIELLIYGQINLHP